MAKWAVQIRGRETPTLRTAALKSIDGSENTPLLRFIRSTYEGSWFGEGYLQPVGVRLQCRVEHVFYATG